MQQKGKERYNTSGPRPWYVLWQGLLIFLSSPQRGWCRELGKAKRSPAQGREVCLHQP